MRFKILVAVLFLFTEVFGQNSVIGINRLKEYNKAIDMANWSSAGRVTGIKNLIQVYRDSADVLRDIKIGDTAYFPRITDAGVNLRPTGFAVIQPRDYNISKKYPVWLVIHGVGERSEGKLENLRNLVQGFIYTPGAPRQYALATDEFKARINSEQFLGVVLTYSGELQPGQINDILNEVEQKYSVDLLREALIGFSLGGGAVGRYITSSLANAERLAMVVMAAPVNWMTNYSYVREAKLPVIGITAQSDPTVSPSNVKTIISTINQGATIPAKLITLPYSGHTGLNEMLSGNNPNVPQSMYTFLGQVTKDSPKAYPTTGGGIPIPPTGPGPVIVREPVPAITTTGQITFNACQTAGADYINWTMFLAPKGVNVYTPVIAGAGTCNTSARVTVEGAYGFIVAAYKGDLKTVDTFYVTYQKTSLPVPKVPSSYNGATGMLIFTDGTQEAAIVNLVFTGTGKKAEAITLTGIKYVY